jgi:hypothetical protein
LTIGTQIALAIPHASPTFIPLFAFRRFPAK